MKREGEEGMLRPIVYRKRRRVRLGRGFSRDELREVGLSLKEARRYGIPVDPRRRTKHEENVEALRQHLKEILNKSGEEKAEA